MPETLVLPALEDLLAFHNPWVWSLLVPILLLFWYRSRRPAEAAIVFPTVARLKGLQPTLRQRARIIVPLLQILALVALVGAGARPRRGDERTVIKSQGIAIQMVLDRSPSMEQTMRYGGEEASRIEIVKRVFLDFVLGTGADSSGGELRGRKTDLIGLTTFARFTEESCPLISQHEPLITAVKNLETVAPALDQYDQPVRNVRQAQKRGIPLKRNPLNATAIGDGLYRAVLSLINAEEDLAEGDESGGYEITGKVAIILTDGENNAGMDPVEAGKYAAENDIRVYYILFTDPVERREHPFFIGSVITGEKDIDELLAVPRQVASQSGGRAFLARSGEELREIYEEIDKLEKTEIGKIEFRSYHELFHWYLIPGIGCAVAAFLLGETVFRRIP